MLDYSVESFGGTKSFIISTVSAMGGKNPFLGIAYIVVGTLCIALGIGFMIKHLLNPRKLGDPSYLSWNNQQSNLNSGGSGREDVPMDRLR